MLGIEAGWCLRAYIRWKRWSLVGYEGWEGGELVPRLSTWSFSAWDSNLMRKELDGGIWLKQLEILLKEDERWPCKLHA